MINHIKQLAISDGTNTVTLSNISEGVDGASTFGYSTEETALTIEDGQTIMDAIEHTLDIRTIVPDDDSQLVTWTSDLTPVTVTALGLDGALIIGEPIRFYKDDQFSERKAVKIMATRKTIPGFDTETGLFENGIWTGDNLLGGFAWADSNGDGLADGWNEDGFTTFSFTTGQQTLEADLTIRNFTQDILFPFEGEQITFSLNNDSRTGTYATEEISIQFLDNTGAVISTATTNFSTTGRKSIMGITPSGTITVRVRFSIAASTATVTSIISDPALQLGTQTTYTTE